VSEPQKTATPPAARPECEATITRVTLFEDRAEVARRGKVTVAAGSTWVVIPGVALTIDDDSLVAGVAAAQAERARVIGSRVVRRVRNVRAATAAEIGAIEADLRAAKDRVLRADLARQRADAELARATALEDGWRKGVGRVPKGTKNVGTWRASFDSIATAIGAGMDAASSTRVELANAQLDERRASLRLDAARTETPRYEATIELQLDARQAGELELELSYRTPCALWRPEHLARLVKTEKGHELVVKTWATVWQRTGEEWKDVPARFSTARPAQQAAPPFLADDYLSLQRRQDKTITVEAREQVIHTAGLERGARAVEEMPGVEDGGEPLNFEPTRPVTIRSDGQPFRVEIAEVRMPATVDLIVYPERMAAPHLRATATLAGNRPLLAGPVRLARGSEIVGRSRINFVGQGEPFELGFGVDDGLRVRRDVTSHTDVTPVIGTKKTTKGVVIWISNLGDAAKKMTVVERVPVSEIGDVEIKLTEVAGWDASDKDGFLRREIEVKPGETPSVILGYKIEASAKVQMNL
jgi:uncharacterized protein (TIGR02231 family)